MPTAPDALREALADRYRIERELGSGGMATVYLAEDLKHKRRVAIKVFRPELAASLGAERFEREIEVVARLQHPHILPLHDSGEAAGLLYYVMPYVEGVSLRQRLSEKGELPISDSVRILAEIAEALAYAHAQGVVHRDLKPDNIMLSGRHPMVLDFGIAKALSSASDRGSLTTSGVTLGTPAYMAPEQAMAEPNIDQRVDIYAFGAMGYELLTGQPPFAGRSSQQVLAAHVVEAPEPISARRSTVPPRLEALLMQCLEKRPADRPQDAEAILLVLEGLATPNDGLTPTGARPRSALSAGFPSTYLAGAVVVVAAIVVLRWQRSAETAAKRVALQTQLTFSGTAEYADISPDGQLLAYREGADSQRVVVKDVRGGTVIPIVPLARDVQALRWSRDGTSLLFRGRVGSDSTMQTDIFPRLGGTARRLPSGGAYALLAPDGAHGVSWSQPPQRPLRFWTDRSDTTLEIVGPDSLSRNTGDADWSGDGRLIAMVTRSNVGVGYGLWTLDVQQKRWQRLYSDSVPLASPRWTGSGRAVYFIRNLDELWRLRVTSRGLPDGLPVKLQSGISAARIALTSDGSRIVFSKVTIAANLWTVTQAKGQRAFRTTQLTRGTAETFGGRLSPDGRQVAFTKAEHAKVDVFVVALAGGEARRVTSDGASGMPAWSPDGQRLAFSTLGEHRRVRVMDVGGVAGHTYAKTEVATTGRIEWAPQPRILYQRYTNREFHWLSPESDVEAPFVASDTLGPVLNPVPSPNGALIAVSWSRQPPGVYAMSVAGADQRLALREAAFGTSIPIGWSSDNRFIYVMNGSRDIQRVPISGGPSEIVGSLPWRAQMCSLTDRGHDLLLICSVYERTADIWMLEDFDPDVPRAKR